MAEILSLSLSTMESMGVMPYIHATLLTAVVAGFIAAFFYLRG
jgi:hypothetical protein